MAVSDDPRLPSEGVAILPPPPRPYSQPPADDQRITVRMRRLDRLLTLAVMILAFLLASLPAHNSDVWLHLASGRLLAHGQYSFGVDPFAFTTAGVRWVNPSWLYDWLLFVVFQYAGGAALVVGKGVLMALLAWTLMRLSRTTEEGSGWVSAVFTALTLLVLGSWMPLQSICVSYLFLALTLWLLETRLAAKGSRTFAAWLPLLPLFALWANLDEWFILGPLTVGLYALGTLLRGREAAGQARTLGVVFLAGLAACLLNPHGYHVFALPPQLPFVAEARTLRGDPILDRLFVSPFQRDYARFRDIPDIGRLLYYPLVLLGIVSFALNCFSRPASAYLRRLPAWLVFFGFSAWDASLIPFFALIAGPVAALNFQEYARHRQAERPRARSSLWTIGGRILTLTVGVGLLLAAWPGWLQGQLQQPRAWTLETDTSLVTAVRQMVSWRREGRIRGQENGFNFSATAAHYFAWFAPEEKSFHDSRWRLCASAAADYVTVRRAVMGDASVKDACRRVLRDRGIRYVVLHDRVPDRVADVFGRLAPARSEWPILFLQGDTVVLGWRDPTQAEGPDRFADWRVDFARRAFQPSEEERAPAHGPDREPDPFGWRAFLSPSASTYSHSRDEATLYLIYFDTLRPLFRFRHRVAWEASLATGVLGADAPSLSTLSRQFLDGHFLWVSRNGPRPRADGRMWSLDALALRLAEDQILRQDDGPPSLLLLAVRAARRAVYDNPNDGHAYRLLGEAYLQLARSTRERAWKQDLPSLAHIRQVQASVALHQSLRVQPDLIQAHTDLYGLYQDMGLLDLALHHLREVFRLTKKRGRIAGESPQAWEERLRQTEQLVGKLDEDVKRRLDQYELQSTERPVLNQALLALEQGLGRKALDTLLASDVAVFGRRGTEIELDLLLTVGRIHDARDWMSALQEADLGHDSYHRLRTLLAAAGGDYDDCEEELGQIAAALDRPMKVVFDAWKLSPVAEKHPGTAAEQPATGLVFKASSRQAVCLKFAQLLLDAPWQQTILELLQNRLRRAEFLERIPEFPANLRRQAEVNVLRGALALERGEVPRAEALLRRALSMWRSEADAASHGGLDFGGRIAAQGMLEWLSRPPAVTP
jgi:hypothetical protein